MRSRGEIRLRKILRIDVTRLAVKVVYVNSRYTAEIFRKIREMAHPPHILFLFFSIFINGFVFQSYKEFLNFHIWNVHLEKSSISFYLEKSFDQKLRQVYSKSDYFMKFILSMQKIYFSSHNRPDFQFWG